MNQYDQKAHLARATAISAAAVLAFAALLLSQAFGERWTALADNLLLAAAPTVAAGLSWQAARRFHHSQRRAWRWIALSAAAWAAGQLAWTFHEVVLGGETPVPSVADIGYLTAPILAVIGLLLLPSGMVSLRVRVRTLLDGLLITALLLQVGWATFMGPLVRASQLGDLGLAVGITYPLSDVVLLAVVVLLWSRDHRTRVPSLGLLSLAFVVLAVADLAFVALVSDSNYATGHLVDVGWFAGYVLIASAAFVAAPKSTRPPVQPMETAISSAGLVLPSVLAGTAVAMSLVGIDGDGAQGEIPRWAFGLVTLLAVGRQSLMLFERHGLQRRLHHESLHDPLTGLANRALATIRIEAALAALADRGNGRCGLLLADIDDFKTVNDSLGHHAGDQLLVAVAERMSEHVRSHDTVARVGGDEFIVIAGDVTDGQLDEVAARLVEVFADPFDVGGITIHAAISIGVTSVGADDEVGPVDLLRDADLAMYAAKRTGGATTQRFAPAMLDAVVERLHLEAELRHTVETHGFAVAFQPVVDLRDLQIVGAEALVRWNHPERGAVPPAEFIPLAEETGLINPLGHWVLREAAFHGARWQRLQPGRAFQLAVNVSARQFERGSFACEVERVLTESGLHGDNLVLELTESDLMRDPASSAEQLTRLKALGVHVAIDDFGTGYSSLAYLRQFPVDLLKIDRSFVTGVAENSDDRAVVDAVCQLGRALGLGVVGEGIEDTHQMDVLRQHGCQLGQGFLFGRPMEAQAFEHRLVGQLTVPAVVDELVPAVAVPRSATRRGAAGQEAPRHA